VDVFQNTPVLKSILHVRAIQARRDYLSALLRGTSDRQRGQETGVSQEKYSRHIQRQTHSKSRSLRIPTGNVKKGNDELLQYDHAIHRRQTARMF
jgi:hypothetical protein